MFGLGVARAHLLAAMQGCTEYREAHLQAANEALSEAQSLIAAWAGYAHARGKG